MQGLFIDGRRPTSKKQVKEVAASEPWRIDVEATSEFGNEFGGALTGLEPGQTVTFVGPDPYSRRVFYGTIKLVNGTHGRGGVSS
jgi:hypothetical protein